MSWHRALRLEIYLLFKDFGSVVDRDWLDADCGLPHWFAKPAKPARTGRRRSRPRRRRRVALHRIEGGRA
jgi:hypothetical protein